MTDEYTPETEEIREAYQIAGDGADFKRRFFERGEDFDSWLRNVKAEAWAEGHKRGIGSYLDVVPLNPYL